MCQTLRAPLQMTRSVHRSFNGRRITGRIDPRFGEQRIHQLLRVCQPERRLVVKGPRKFEERSADVQQSRGVDLRELPFVLDKKLMQELSLWTHGRFFAILSANGLSGRDLIQILGSHVNGVDGVHFRFKLEEIVVLSIINRVGSDDAIVAEGLHDGGRISRGRSSLREDHGRTRLFAPFGRRETSHRLRAAIRGASVRAARTNSRVGTGSVAVAVAVALAVAIAVAAETVDDDATGRKKGVQGR